MFPATCLYFKPELLLFFHSVIHLSIHPSIRPFIHSVDHHTTDVEYITKVMILYFWYFK